MPVSHSYTQPSTALLPPPTTNKLESSTRAAHLKSDRKASKVLGVTITRAPHLCTDRKASQMLGTTVIRSDWDSFACNPSPSELLHGADARDPSPKKKKSLSKSKWMKIGSGGGGSGPGLKDQRIARRAQKVILAGIPPVSPTLRGRRHTVSYGSGVELMLPPSNAREWPNSPSSPSYCSDTASITPSSRAEDNDRPSTPSSPFMPLNPVVQERKQMIRSATKSVQLLGSEASNVIMRRVERENMGRIGWDN